VEEIPCSEGKKITVLVRSSLDNMEPIKVICVQQELKNEKFIIIAVVEFMSRNILL